MPDGVSITLEIDPRQLADVTEHLEGIRNGMERACSTAINKTLPRLRTIEARAVQDELNLKYGDVLEVMSIRKASRTQLSGSVFARRKPIPLYQYNAKQTAKGVSVQVRRGKGREEIPHLFIAKMKSGHVGVFERAGGKGHRTYVLTQIVDKKGRTVARRTSHQLPIHEKFGPTVVGVLAGKPGMLESLRTTGNELLAKNLDSQVDWLVEKGRAE